ncbi:MAG: SPFH domain-containing protein [Clostridia bacterium]|nr:SPFH domain-containing protein [Clostridia bacterium]
MGLFRDKRKVGFIADVIRCDEKDYLIWKWHPDGTESGEHKREYQIRLNSKIRVKDGEVAVFVYKQKNGVCQDFLLGPVDETLKTLNMPFVSWFLGLGYGGQSPFQAEIYYINLAGVVQVKFGVPYFNIYDEKYPDFGVPVAVRGTLTFKIDDYQEFIKMHRMTEFTLDEFKEQVVDTVKRFVKGYVALAPFTLKIPVMQIESELIQINEYVEVELTKKLKDTFGVAVTSVDINAIDVDKESEEYARLMEVTRDFVTEKTKLDLLDYEERQKIDRREWGYAQHMATKTANFDAYRTAKQTEVGVATANAFGKMGENGVGKVQTGGGSGFNPVEIMTGMAMGGVMVNNMTGFMNSAFNGGQTQGAVPPPIPQTAYWIVSNGQKAGPFDMQTLGQMALSGALQKDTLVWKQGMSNWDKAENVPEILALFGAVPPPIV